MFTELENTINSITGGPSSDQAVPQIGSILSIAVIISNFFRIVGMGLAVVAMAYSFIMFASSTGDPDKIEKAQQGLLWSGVGIFVTLIAWVIKGILLRKFGISEDVVY